MTTIVTPEIKQDHPESQEWPILGPGLPDTTREDRADGFDPTQGRKLGSRPLRRPHAGTQTRTDPYDDPTQGRKLAPTPTTTPPRDANSAAHPYDDPTQGRKLGADPYDDPTQGRKLGADPYDDPTRAR